MKFKTGDILKLTNEPYDWRDGQIEFAVITKVRHLNPINHEVDIAQGHHNYHLALTIFFHERDGLSHKGWGVYISDVKPELIELSNKTNFKWAK